VWFVHLLGIAYLGFSGWFSVGSGEEIRKSAVNDQILASWGSVILEVMVDFWVLLLERLWI
jgi:hypothetical protein